jgi:predicted transposase YbfD/YdcC
MDRSIPFLNHFTIIADPRIVGMITYPLDELLFLTLCGVLCGFDDFDEITMWGESNLDWFKQFLPYENGIPKAKTVRLVLNHLDAKAFEISFESWTSSLSKELKGVVAIDGKTICGSKKTRSGSGAAHIVSAFAHDLGIVLAQEKVLEKSNEITAIPELLKRLTLAGTVVTIDAMGTQKEISKAIIEQKADYILALKKNHSDLYSDVATYFSKIDKCEIYDEFEDTDYGHGRIEIRNCKVISDIKWLQEAHEDWAEMCSIVKVEATRIVKKTKEASNETRYYS